MKALARGRISPKMRMAFLLGATALATLNRATPAFAQQSESAAQISFNISSGALGPALTEWAEISGFRLLAPSAALAGVHTRGAAGLLTPAQALAHLLSGSGLEYKFSGPRTVTIGHAGGSADVGPDVPGAVALETINVESTADQSPYGPGVGYVATRSETATKTDTPIVRTPQTISVVTRQQIDDQNAQSVPEALRYTSGVVPEQRGTNEDSLEYLYARGFQIDEYLNGLILPGGINEGYNVTSVDTYLLDRIELLQGPASVLYGQASPGGILDMQSKRPTDYPLHEIEVQSGNYNRIQGSLDMSDKLNADGTLLGRITGDAFDTDTQTHFIHEKRIAVAPTLTWRPDAKTDLTIFAYFQDDPEAGSYNFVPAQGTVLPGVQIPRSFDPGDPGFDQFKKIQESIGYSFTHAFNDIWSFDQNFRYLHSDETVQYVADDVGISSNGQDLLRETYGNHGIDNTITLDNHVQAKFATGPLSHTALFGVDYYWTDYDHIFQGNFNAPSLSINSPVYFQAIPPFNFVYGSSGDQKLDQIGVYAQDQIHWDHWELIAGLREDVAGEKTIGLTDGAVTQQTNTALTWRAGLLYHFDNGVAPYFNYATSFQPEVGTTISGTPFAPTTGQQYEAGIKYQPPGSNTIVTASLFNITQQNVLTADPTNGNFQVQTGQVRSRGATLEAHVSLTQDLNFIGSYTFDDLRNTESTTNDLGKVPVGIPENLLSAWLTYDLPLQELRGLQLGGGVRYLGSSWGDAANTFEVPSVTLFDAAVHYDLGKRWPSLKGVSLSVTASNIFDKTYISSCLNALYCTFGEGRLVLANVKYRW